MSAAAISLLPPALHPASASVGDPEATRTVYVTIALLVVLAVGFAVLAVWLVRRTRPEPQLLAPLEEMDTRAWRRQDPAGQRRALDASRPVGARPVRREAAEPTVDSDFAAERPVRDFDDLTDGPEPEPGADDLEAAADSNDADHAGEPDEAVDAAEAGADDTDESSDDTQAPEDAEGGADDDTADLDRRDDDAVEILPGDAS